MLKNNKRPGSVWSSSTAVAGPMRIVLSIAALLAAVTVGGAAALADMVVVQQDNTPIASAPGVGGVIVTRVDAGVALTVLGRDGEWLQVASPQLATAGMLWVPAARVSEIVATPVELAPAETATATTATPQFRIIDAAVESGATGSQSDAALPNVKPAGGTAPAETRSRQANATMSAGATLQSTGAVTGTAGAATATAGAATSTSGNGVFGENNSTPALGGNSVNPVGNSTPAVSGASTSAVTGNSTPAVGNSTPAFSGNATPAVGGNQNPAVTGNTTPAMGNAVPGFGS